MVSRTFTITHEGKRRIQDRTLIGLAVRTEGISRKESKIHDRMKSGYKGRILFIWRKMKLVLRK